MVPLLLFVPPYFGVAAMGMKTIAGITALQSFVGAISGAFGHHRYKRINRSLVLNMGGSMAAGALLGSVSSLYISADIILFIFASMSVIAAVLMLKRKDEQEEDIETGDISFNIKLTIITGFILGVLSGIIGQGGAFLFIPVMLHLLHIPTRIAIGSALVIGILSSIAVLIGRIGTNQLPYAMAVVITIGVVIGAQIGSVVSQYTPKVILRRILALIITSTAIKIWYEILFVGV